MKFRHFYREKDTIGGGGSQHPVTVFSDTDRKIIEKAYDKAKEFHRNVNHKYDNKDYFDTHVREVYLFALEYTYLIPAEYRVAVLIASLLHDSIEDARVTYGDIKKLFGEEVAEMVYALSNDKGRTRKERAGNNYYKGIRNTPFATFIKLCDRLANVKYSQSSSSSMFKVYQKEHPKFVKQLKGTHTLWGQVLYALKKEFDFFEADYTPLYSELEDLIGVDINEFKIIYTEL